MKTQSLVLLTPVPEGVVPLDVFEVQEGSIDPGQLSESRALVKLVGLSADPYQRGRFKSASAVGVVNGYVVGVCVESRHERLKQGMLFGSFLPYTTAQFVDPDKIQWWDLTPYCSLEGNDPKKSISLGLGLLGMPGATAWGGLFKVLSPKAGETLFVSACSGAVGSLVAQLAAKVAGVTVIGSCGSPEKVEHCKKLGAHHALDYHAYPTAADLAKAIKDFAPQGIDMNFENVGGHHFDAAFQCLKQGGRVAVCGVISQYNNSPGSLGSTGNLVNLGSMIYTAQRIEGFVAGPYIREGSFLPAMASYYQQGLLINEETVFQGISSWPKAFVEGVMGGQHLGKVVVML